MEKSSLDKKEKKVYDRDLLVRLLRYLRPYKTQVFIGTVLMLVSSVFAVSEPIILKIAIDRYIIDTQNFSGLAVMGLIYVTVLIFGFFTIFIHSYMMGVIGQKVMFDMRMQIFGHYQKLAVRYFDKNPAGKLITRVTNDVDALNEMFTSGVVAILGDIVKLGIIIVVLLYLNVQLALVTFSIIPFLFIAAFIFKKKVRKMFDIIREQLSRINTFLQENITGMKIIQLFNREELNFKEFESINRSYLSAYLKTILYYAVFFPVVMVLSSIAIALIIWFGGINIIKGTLTFGALVAFIQYAQMFYRPIQDISEKYNIIQSALAASQRIFKVLDTKDYIPDPDKEMAIDQSNNKKVEFQNVWFAYNENNYVLRDVSFEVKTGENIAVVGATGAGKTSLINLLCRFYDVSEGQVIVDGINVKDLKKENLRKKVGLVLQDVFLFSGSIRDNISLWNDKIYEEKIVQSAEHIDAKDFIMQLPGNFSEDVRERGSRLSTGQKQLISFARALAYNPEILILDEATSSVDTETEIKIQKALKKLMENRTSIVIAHRLSTIKSADKIIVLHKGEIKEIGNHVELLQKKGIYYRLYQLQFKDQEINNFPGGKQ
ncbi:ABC transporter ATP-binding protein [candidate division KSB1 bacterium]